jgi:hypothetical protein
MSVLPKRRSREEMAAGFRKRMTENQNKAEGGFYAPLFRRDISIPFMKCPEGYHTIDILDYIAGKNDPMPGEPSYCFEFFIYTDVGAGQGPIICLSKTFGLPDPIAEDRARKQRDGAEDSIIKALLPNTSARVLYNVICSDNKEEEMKGVQVFHTSSYLMEDYLREMAKGSVRPGMEGIDPLVNFTDPVEGKSIKFKREGKVEKTKFILHQFIDRPKGFIIPDSDLEKVFILDELIHIPTYEEVAEYYYGKGQSMPSERSLGGTQTPPGEEPTRRSRYDTQADVPNEIAKPVQERSESSSNPCPAGHVFGQDANKFMKDCEPCTKWQECVREKNKLADATKVTAPESKPETPQPTPAPEPAKPAEAPATASPVPEEGRRRRRSS